MEELKQKGETLAKKLNNFIPIIYASGKNEPITYNWKIKFNETGKIPAFCNTLPELNHNEMVGFDGGDPSSRAKLTTGQDKTKNLLKQFHFIFLKDKTDHPRIILRMDILKDIFEEEGFGVEVLELEGKNIWEKIFPSILLADWTAYFTAQQYGLNAQETKIIKRFKNTIIERGGKLQ